MERIIVSDGGPTEAVVMVPVVPKKGDEITIDRSQVVANNGSPMAGGTIRLTGESAVRVNGEPVPLFHFERVEAEKPRRPTPGQAL